MSVAEDVFQVPTVIVATPAAVARASALAQHRGASHNEHIIAQQAEHMPEQPGAHDGMVGVFGWQVDKSWLLELVYYSIEVGALHID